MNDIQCALNKYAMWRRCVTYRHIFCHRRWILIHTRKCRSRACWHSKRLGHNLSSQPWYIRWCLQCDVTHVHVNSSESFDVHDVTSHHVNIIPLCDVSQTHTRTSVLTHTRTHIQLLILYHIQTNMELSIRNHRLLTYYALSINWNVHCLYGKVEASLSWYELQIYYITIQLNRTVTNTPNDKMQACQTQWSNIFGHTPFVLRYYHSDVVPIAV